MKGVPHHTQLTLTSCNLHDMSATSCCSRGKAAILRCTPFSCFLTVRHQKILLIAGNIVHSFPFFGLFTPTPVLSTSPLSPVWFLLYYLIPINLSAIGIKGYFFFYYLFFSSKKQAQILMHVRQAFYDWVTKQARHWTLTFIVFFSLVPPHSEPPLLLTMSQLSYTGLSPPGDAAYSQSSVFSTHVNTLGNLYMPSLVGFCHINPLHFQHSHVRSFLLTMSLGAPRRLVGLWALLAAIMPKTKKAPGSQ